MTQLYFKSYIAVTVTKNGEKLQQNEETADPSGLQSNFAIPNLRRPSKSILYLEVRFDNIGHVKV